MRPLGKKQFLYKSPLFVVVGFFIFFILLAINPIRKTILPLGRNIISPFATLRERIHLFEKSFSSYFETHSYLARQNESLKKDLQEKEIELLSVEALKNENDILKQSLGRTTGTKTVLGVIISRPPKTPYDVLSVDIGYEDGVRQGAKVFSKGVLLGTVSAAYKTYSDITLYSNPDEKIDGILSGTATHITLEGIGGGSFVFDIPRELNIEKGTVVIAQDLGIFPIAKVVGEKNLRREALVKMLATSPVNVQSIRFVEIEKK